MATISAEYINHQSSLTISNAIANPDGTYTWVVSEKDPSVQNWIDTTGIGEGTMTIRWTGYTGTQGLPTITTQVVDLDQLDTVLSEGTATVTPEQREEQLAERAAGYANVFHSIATT